MPASKEKYEKSTLSSRQSRLYLQNLLDYMQSERPYLKEDLRLSEVAEFIDVPVHHVSQIINQELGLNFYDFVNSYRVKEAQRQLTNPENRKFTILAIAHNAGFGNKASFNRAFKKYSGVTPSEYINTNGANSER